jgi:glycosyltransferase involved in cell wall biosynthesis
LVATYARWKGHEVFLKAAARLWAKPDRPPMRFYVVGGPVYRTTGSQYTREELQATALKLGLGAVVGFVDFQADPAPVYRALDVVVHASTLPEPFGLTIAEAMACGRATLVSQAGGAVDLFRDGEDAVGVSPGDVDCLAEAIAELVRTPMRRLSLGVAAARTGRLRFHRDRLGPRLLDIYCQLLNQQRQ